MKQVQVVCLLNIVKIKDRDPRFNLTVVLEDKTPCDSTAFANFKNIELTPTRPLALGDVQYLLNAKGKGSLLNSKKSFRFNNVPAEIGIGRYKSSDDKYYFVRVKLLEDLVRTCYLSPSQIKNLKYVDLGYEFEEDPEFVIDDDSIDFGNEEEKKTKKA